jgi:hypothetical protein
MRRRRDGVRVHVLVKPAEVGLGDSDGDGTYNKGEQTVRGQDGDDADGYNCCRR